MLKAPIAALSLAVSSLALPQAASAQEDAAVDEVTAREMAAFQKMLEIFDTSDAPPIAEEQLALARITSGKILPAGTYARMMQETFDQILAPMMGLFAMAKPADIAAATGVPEEQLYELDQEALAAAGALIDPHAEQRNKKVFEAIVPLMTEAFTEIEPVLREGMARAYARKFSAEQLREINAFFNTPAGEFYAAESFVLLADPEIMSASMQAMPVMLEKVMAKIPELEKDVEDVPPPRTLADLDVAQMQQLADLLSVDIGELERFRDSTQDEQAEE